MAATNEQRTLWVNVDLALKLLFPFVLAIIGWILGQIDELHGTTSSHTSSIVALETAQVVKDDLAELQKSWQLSRDNITETLHRIDSKVTAIQTQIAERKN